VEEAKEQETSSLTWIADLDLENSEEVFSRPLPISADSPSDVFSRKMHLLFRRAQGAGLEDPTGTLRKDIYSCLTWMWRDLRDVARCTIAAFGSFLATRHCRGTEIAQRFLVELEYVYWELQFAALFCIMSEENYKSVCLRLYDDLGDISKKYSFQTKVRKLWPLRSQCATWRQTRELARFLFPAAFMRSFNGASPPPRVINKLISLARLPLELKGPLFVGEESNVDAVREPGREDDPLSGIRFYADKHALMELIPSKKEASKMERGDTTKLEIDVRLVMDSEYREEQDLEFFERAKGDKGWRKTFDNDIHRPFSTLWTIHTMTAKMGWGVKEIVTVFTGFGASQEPNLDSLIARVFERTNKVAKFALKDISGYKPTKTEAYLTCLQYEASSKWIYGMAADTAGVPLVFGEGRLKAEAKFAFDRRKKTQATVDVAQEAEICRRLFEFKSEILIVTPKSDRKNPEVPLSDNEVDEKTCEFHKIDSKQALGDVKRDVLSEKSRIEKFLKHAKVLLPEDKDLDLDWKSIQAAIKEHKNHTQAFRAMQARPWGVSRTALTAYTIKNLSEPHHHPETCLWKAIQCLSTAKHGAACPEKLFLPIRPWEIEHLCKLMGLHAKYQAPADKRTGILPGWYMALAWGAIGHPLRGKILEKMGFLNARDFMKPYFEKDKEKRDEEIKTRNKKVSKYREYKVNSPLADAIKKYDEWLQKDPPTLGVKVAEALTPSSPLPTPPQRPAPLPVPPRPAPQPARPPAAAIPIPAASASSSSSLTAALAERFKRRNSAAARLGL
jgi:hypothetical protein